MELLDKYFTLTPLQRSLFEQLQGLYADWNSKINVISRRDIENFYERHVLHSLAIAKIELIEAGQTVIDVGCGGGFPVIPLAILMPDVQFTAVDSIGKKIKVVQAIAQELGLNNVTAHNCRVEALPGKWDWVVSRAVAPTADLIGWTRGKFTKGAILLKGGDLIEEISEARIASSKVSIMPINSWFEGDFFDTKSVVIIKC